MARKIKKVLDIKVNNVRCIAISLILPVNLALLEGKTDTDKVSRSDITFIVKSYNFKKNYMPKPRIHYCELLVDDFGALAKQPPNAPFRSKVFRYFLKLVNPNPKAAISRRNCRNQSQINRERRRHAQNKYFYVIHPYSDLEFYRELIFLVVGLWELVTNPLSASFGTVWLYQEEDFIFVGNFITYPNITVFTVELLWIFSCFFAAYKERRTNIIEFNHWKIVKRYLLTYFIVDMLYLAPPYQSHFYEQYVYWINLAIFFRFGTIVTYLKRFLYDLGVPESAVTLITLIVVTFFMVHVFACVFYILPFQFKKRDDELWLVRTGLHPDTNLIKVYFSCLSMVQTHFWGLGEAIIKVENLMENLILTFAMIVGRLWSLFLLATMLRVFTVSSLSESKYEEYLLQLKTFITQRQIPKELAERLLEYYRYKYQHHYFNERAIFNAMSQYLKRELLLYGAKNVINKVTMFKYFPKSMIASIIDKCKVMVFLNHDIIVNVGDLVENVYFISCGTLAVYNHRRVELAHLSDGEEIGLKAVITLGDTYHSNTYISIETSEVYVISVKDFRQIVFNKNDILMYFYKKVEERAKEMEKIELLACSQGVDLLSELHRGKILEHPRVRTRYFDP